MLLEVIISTLLYGLRGLLGPENLSDIPNWTAYTQGVKSIFQLAGFKPSKITGS